MSAVFRRLRRTNKKAAKYRFTASLRELLLEAEDDSWKPQTVIVSFLHRRRKVSSRERRWEDSFSKPEQTVIVWPEQAPENVDILTTLYKNPSDETFEDKEWTIVVEEVTAKGKRKPIAAVPLNLRLLVLEMPDEKTELKLKLRPLNVHLKQCSLLLILSSHLVKEGFRDDMSQASSVSQVERSSREQSVSDIANLGDLKEVEDTPENVEARKELANISDSILKWGDGTPKTSGRQKTEEHHDDRPKVPAHASVKIQKPEDLEDRASKSATPSSAVRPPWRVEGSGGRRPSQDIVQEQLSKIPVEAHFEVNERSQPVPIPMPHPQVLNAQAASSPRTLSRAHSPRAPSRDRAPEPKDGEKLLDWAQRISLGYHGVKVSDYTKSWRSGLALCAILHAYRQEVFGEYDQLDFSETLNGRKANVKKALLTAQAIGISDIPDENDILTPDSKVIKLLLERIRRVVEDNMDMPTPTAGSDHRISQMFPVSESEMKVIDEINKIKEKREAEDAVDYSGVQDTPDTTRFDAVVHVSGSAAGTSNGYGHDEEDGSGAFQRNFALNDDGMITPKLPSLRASGRATSPSKQEELRRKARQMIDNPAAALANTNPEDSRRRREARRLIEEAVVDGGNSVMHGSSSNLYRSPSIRSRTSLGGSSSDLRRIELVRPSVTIQTTFKKRDPSPVLQRKRYEADTPHLPAMGRPTQTMGDRLKQRVGTGATGGMSMPAAGSALDRVKRYGSMRGQELRDSISLMAKQYGIQDPLGGSQSSINDQATPTRKVDKSQWERDVENVEGTRVEQAKVAQRLDDVTQQAAAIQSKIAEAEKASSEEQTLLETYISLTNEKNSLVGRQEYFNIIENIRETAAEIKQLNEELGQIARNTADGDDYYKPADEKERTDRVMASYLSAIGRKDQLVQKLFATEEQLMEDEDRLNSLTLERASNFIRGNDEPLTASKRLMTWLRG